MKITGNRMRPFSRGRVRARRSTAVTVFAVLSAVALAGCTIPEGEPAANESAAPSVELGSAAELVPDSLKDKALKVVVLEDYPPLGYREGGELVGLSPDMVKAIAADTGLNIEIETASFDSIIPGLQSKRWDFAAPTFTITDERTKILDFVTLTQGFSTYVSSADLDVSVEDPSDVCGRTVGALSGGVEAAALEVQSTQCTAEGKAPVTVSTFASANQTALALSSARVEAVRLDSTQVDAFVKAGDGKFEVSSLKLDEATTGIGFPKGSEFGPIVLQAVKDLIANGTYSDISEKNGMTSSEITEPELLT